MLNFFLIYITITLTTSIYTVICPAENMTPQVNQANTFQNSDEEFEFYMQKLRENKESIKKLLDIRHKWSPYLNKTTHFVETLSRDPEFQESFDTVLSRWNSHKMMLYQFGWMVFFWIFKNFFLFQIKGWKSRFIYSLFSFLVYFGGTFYLVPRVLFGPAFNQCLTIAWSHYKRVLPNGQY